jgi:hypothetical protein
MRYNSLKVGCINFSVHGMFNIGVPIQ